MILFADSGSTKCSWALCDVQENIVFKCDTIGFNPYFINKDRIIEHLKESELNKYNKDIETVFFYGAGCSSEDKNNIIKEALSQFFRSSKIVVRHDIDAACYAMYNGAPNITCILGTGSNSCYYDGKNIIEHAPSLGFLIGDEGSGNNFGKKILNLYFNKALPNNLSRKLEENYETNWSIIKDNIYGNDRANVYLAKYFPFVSENREHPIIKDIIYKALNEFFELHICCYDNHKEIEINFIGSVSYYLSDEIHIVAKKYNCKIGNIVQNPINRLVNFHFNNITSVKSRYGNSN
tara:strand:+ start:4620 stop:5498 length:879 start_codon:yes stop_codon:yes gene_type:complete